jgi:DNA-binding beta-propeller fold protein YncE
MNVKSVSLLIAQLMMLKPGHLLSQTYDIPPALLGSQGMQRPFASRSENTAAEGDSITDSEDDKSSRAHKPKRVLLASGLQGSIGSAIGPDGALYVPEGIAGTVSRIDRETGAVTLFASGLPKSPFGVGGGAMDLAFLGNTAYVLVSGVDPDSGGNDLDGIYRVDGPESFTVVANLGRWSSTHPPKTKFNLPEGVQFAIETYRGELIVSDGHHNRVVAIKMDTCLSSPPDDDSNIRELIAFDDIVPTGLAVSGNTIYLAEAGPVPHLPANGKIVEFQPNSTVARKVAFGAPLLVDVEPGPHHQLYALSQGTWMGAMEGDPALPGTGSIVRVNDAGQFTVVVDHLDRPTSLEFVGNTAYVVSLTGEVWKIEGISSARSHSPR